MNDNKKYKGKSGSIKRRSLKLKAELDRWVRLLKNEYDPEKIILFGSVANNMIGEWSDIDLIIIKNTEKPFLERIKEVLIFLQPKVGTDILVYTPEEYKNLSKNRSFFKQEINSKGKTIYERAI